MQAQSLSEKHRHKQNLQQWQQLISDLQTMRAWLGQSEAELSQLRGLDLSTDIHTIQQRIKKLKVCLVYLCVCVCLVSLPVSGEQTFIQSYCYFYMKRRILQNPLKFNNVHLLSQRNPAVVLVLSPSCPTHSFQCPPLLTLPFRSC